MPSSCILPLNAQFYVGKVEHLQVVAVVKIFVEQFNELLLYLTEL